ncbi:hypothetical protein G7Y89_g4868 [Cudoniella acicularis]|uniref:Peptidase A1 domain-containing protein n=1 Tax=Cudoniella acicularis TaxID=354080 RepID=A0A8H4RQS1_9HELO|nr:hypothetical protein G7Y89_g4868 [Cudoniella acicularis]
MRLQIFCSLPLALNLLSSAVASPWDNSRDVVKKRSTSDTTGSTPLVVAPSQYFDGDDGQWSSLAIRVGTPPQTVRVLVSTNSPQTLVPMQQYACSQELINPVPVNCASDRGGLFNANASSTWLDQGNYGINANGVGFEANLGYSEAVDYGLETLGVGYVTDGTSGPTLTNQTVAGMPYVSPFYLFTPNSANFTLASDVSRDIVVAIQAITYSGTTQASLLPQPEYAFIESTDPNIWLPQAAVQGFEKAFQLSLDNATGLYLINSSRYQDLTNQNPSVTFTLANSISGGQSVEINLPIGALLLPAKYPFIPSTNGTWHYFPLRTAANDTQITLGRAFLQEAYLTVNYERGNFSVSQCTWQDGAAVQLTTIQSISSLSSTTKSKGIATGAIAGIVIAIIFIVAIAGAVFYFYRRRKKNNTVIELTNRVPAVAPSNPSKTDEENAVTDFYAAENAEKKDEPGLPKYIPPAERSELSAAPLVHQLPEHDNREGDYATEARRMMSVRKAASTAELDGSGFLHELEADYPEPGELESPPQSTTASPVMTAASPVATSRSTLPSQIQSRSGTLRSDTLRSNLRSDTLRSDIVSPIESPILPHLQMARGSREASPARSWFNSFFHSEPSEMSSPAGSSSPTPQRSRRPSSPSVSPSRFTSRGAPTVAIPLSNHPSFRDLQQPPE